MSTDTTSVGGAAAPAPPGKAAKAADGTMAAKGADPRRWWVLIVISFAQFVIAIDASVVNVMGPQLQQAIHLSTPALQWVMNIYVLLFGGLLLLGGRLADVVGRKSVFLGGLGLFTLASLAVGLSHTEGQILSARAVQGIAAAALSPASLSILVTSFPDTAERSKAFGIWGAVIGVGASVGTVIGGAIGNSDWRWAFWINVPVGIVVGLVAGVLIRRSIRTGPRPSTDFAGALTATGGLILLIYGIITSSTHGWTASQTLLSFAGAVLLLAAFLVIESRTSEPLLPLRLFRSRSIVAGTLGEFLTSALMMPLFFLLPIYMEDVTGYSPLRTGLAWLPTSIGLMIFAGVASKLVTKIGPQLIYLLGTVFLAGTLAVAIGIPMRASYTSFMLPLSALFGIGLVFCLIATPVVGTANATEEDAGTTSALLNASTQIGAAFGIAVSVTVLNNTMTEQLKHGATQQAALVHGLTTAFIGLTVMLALSVLNGIFGFRGLAKPGSAPDAGVAATAVE